MELRIELLNLDISDAAGHEHRIQPIAQRTADVLASLLEEQASGAGRESAEIESVSAPAVSLDLGRTTDQQAANEIAAACLDALAVLLEI
jgi:hypothetical protein